MNPFDLTSQQRTAFADQIAQIVGLIMDRKNYYYEISPKRLNNAIDHFLKDLERLESIQEDSISITKFAGYLGFWIRKIKPIRVAFPKSVGLTPSEIDQNEDELINEIVSIILAIDLLLRFREKADSLLLDDPQRYHCNQLRQTAGLDKCTGCDCVEEYAGEYFSMGQNRHWDYLVYSMRYRTFGPHHFVSVLDHILTGACQMRSSNIFRSGDKPI